MKYLLLLVLVLLCSACTKGEVTAQTMDEATVLCATRQGVKVVRPFMLSLRPALFVECNNGQYLAFSQKEQN